MSVGCGGPCCRFSSTSKVSEPVTKTPETPETEFPEGKERESLSPRTTQKPPNNSPEIRPPSGRDESGRFPKGVSGNPGGRPKTNVELVEAARELTAMALQVWEKAMTDFLEGNGDASQALKAASDSMARAWGKPPERVALHAVVGVQDRERTEAELVAWVKRLAGEDTVAPAAERAQPQLVSSASVDLLEGVTSATRNSPTRAETLSSSPARRRTAAEEKRVPPKPPWGSTGTRGM